jgi:predicted transcriptional regulator
MEGMPATMTKPPATARTVRVPDNLWNDALARATERDESLSAVIRRALRDYTAQETSNAD